MPLGRGAGLLEHVVAIAPNDGAQRRIGALAGVDGREHALGDLEGSRASLTIRAREVAHPGRREAARTPELAHRIDRRRHPLSPGVADEMQREKGRRLVDADLVQSMHAAVAEEPRAKRSARNGMLEQRRERAERAPADARKT